jgi:XTP/dITP diphosphohydrolase
LALAAKLVDRRDHSGADTPIDEPELPQDLDEELLGLILLGLVAGARRRGLDAEAALRRSSLAFADALAQHAASASPQ